MEQGLVGNSPFQTPYNLESRFTPIKEEQNAKYSPPTAKNWNEHSSRLLRKSSIDVTYLINSYT